MENSLEKSIHSALSSIRPDTPGSIIDALARSVTRSISYDAQLSRLTRDEIVKAITGSCRSDRHDQVMTALREYVQKYRAAKEEFSRRSAASANEDMISWGFLLQCWYCFLEHGDVCCVRPLTISFLSKWLIKKGEYIGKDELDWCAHRAVEDAEEFPREEKERRMKEADAWTDNRAMGDVQIRYGAVMATRPVKEAYPTEESVRQKWSVGEQEKYLSLEAEASVIGKFIHEDGYLSRARIDLMNRVNNPARVDVNGSETVVYSYEPTVSVQEVDDLFSSLQSRYRQVQAELNGMKKKIDDYIFAEKMRIDSEHASALREWNVQNQHFADERKLLEEEEEIRRNELIKAVKALKIVIPKRLKSIYLLLTSK